MLQELKQKADLIIGNAVDIPIIVSSEIQKQSFTIKENKIIGLMCLTFFENTSFCCNTELLFSIFPCEVISNTEIATE